MFDAGVADNDRLSRHGRVFHVQRLAIDVDDAPGFAVERGNLVENAALDADEFIFRGAAHLGEFETFRGSQRRQFAFAVAGGRNSGAGRAQAEGIKPADPQGGGHFQGGGAAHACAQGNGPVDGRAEPAEVDAALAELQEHAFDVIGPVRGRIAPDLIYRENFTLGESRGDKLDLAVRARRGREPDIPVHRQRHDQPVVVIGVVSQELEPAGCAADVRWRVPEIAFEQRLNLLSVNKCHNTSGVMRMDRRQLVKTDCMCG